MLILFDTLKKCSKSHMLPGYDRLQSHTVQETIEVVSFGMQNKVMLQSVFASHLPQRMRATLVSLLSIDPYPHHVATALEFVANYLVESFRKGQVKQQTLHKILKISMEALEQVPQCSGPLQSMRDNMTDRLGSLLHVQSEVVTESFEHSSEPSQGEATRAAQGGAGNFDFSDSPSNAGLDAAAAYPSENDALPDDHSLQDMSVDDFEQWDWNSFAESHLDFEDHGDGMFLSEHGLLEVCGNVNQLVYPETQRTDLWRTRTRFTSPDSNLYPELTSGRP
jgi:hypothetical protein